MTIKIQTNIKKSIHYFKESSCFYDSISKNYLGIVYKNGDGVDKNIYFAKIYFKEAIKEKEESYSMYNLARIYYFGIEHKIKIRKAISLLEKASKKQLFIADLFLSFIYSDCDNKIYFNQYLNKYQIYFKLFNYQSLDKFQKFLREYDLLHCYDYLHDLAYFLINGKFYERKMQNNDNAQINNRSLRKDINTDFYKGFYD